MSRRERPAKPALTREAIVAVALAVLRSDGLEKVTMRRLAQELDTGPASLYVYVRNTAELHAAVLDEVLGELDVAVARTGDGDWQTRLERLLVSYTVLLFGHPALARSALVARPSGPHYLDLLETLLTLLAEGGVPDGRAAWGVDVLLQFGTATAAEQAARHAAPGADGELDALAAAVQASSAQTRPRLAAVADDVLSGTPEDRLAWGFRVLLTGVARTARPGQETG